MRKYDLLIFDLDGTLADTSEGIYNAHRHTLERMGHEYQPSELDGVIGGALIDIYTKRFHFSSDDARTAIEIYRKWYAEYGKKQAELYPGVGETLALLKEKGYRLAVATLKLEAFAQEMLKTLGVADCFEVINGVDANDSLTKCDIINKTIQDCRTEKEKAVLIGDSMNDADGAKKAGIDFIGCLYGFGFKEAEEVYLAGGKSVVCSFDELVKNVRFP